ncbi:SurA N-terminal domain-containing protein [Dietzia alimentaria]|uniref:SurA N-terminal domain-containing protein n=1 Tax=Dietzia alimentaria TaxID=665550 RepID=UPI001EE64175|nr:SurA N-terminal domain-containing protein [Dietzia alimentaria]
MLSRTLRTVVVAAGAVLIAAGCSAGGDDGDTAPAETQAAAEQTEQGDGADSGAEQADGPDTSGIPDPVAEVNGTKISREEFLSVFESQYKQMSMQAQMTGQPVDEEQLKKMTSEGLVGTELLLQEAKKRGIDVSDDEVKAELAVFAERNQVSADEFITGMGEQGLDRQDVLDQIDKQLRVQKLLAEEYGEFEATDAEVDQAYKQVADQQAAMGGGEGAQQLPPLEEVRGEVEEQVSTEKEAKAMEELSQKLRKNADVTIHI